MNCPACTVLAPVGALACGSCDTLLHRDRLQELARLAAEAESPTEALSAWREALDLLPRDTRQFGQIEQRIRDLSKELDAPFAPASPGSAKAGGSAKASGARHGRILGGALTAAALLWKGKALVLLAVSKLKFLVLGLSKLSTVLTMFASFAVYASFWGWRFAAGFVLSIYVHEIGHVVALRRFGIAATAPMFIPGFGALVRLKQYPATPREDARVGIAGPIWGAGAAIATWGVAVATDSALMYAIASTGALINLFNLIPVASLDGGRAYRGMSRIQRGIVTGALGFAWAVTHVPFTFIVALVLGGRALFQREEPAEGDTPTTVWFAALAFVLSAIAATAPTL